MHENAGKKMKFRKTYRGDENVLGKNKTHELNEWAVFYAALKIISVGYVGSESNENERFTYSLFGGNKITFLVHRAQPLQLKK